MAKPKIPKKPNGGQEVVSSTNTSTPTPSTPVASQILADAAAPATGPRPQRKTEPKKARMPEIVRTDSRSNLVPINMDDEIRRLAYLLSERRGFEPGHETEDWLAAEHEVNQRYHQHQHSA
jgi:hypothetical protein